VLRQREACSQGRIMVYEQSQKREGGIKMRRWKFSVFVMIFLFGLVSVVWGADRGSINSGETKS